MGERMAGAGLGQGNCLQKDAKVAKAGFARNPEVRDQKSEVSERPATIRMEGEI